MIQMRIWKLSVEAMEKMKRGDRKEKKQVTTNAEAAALLDQYLPDHIKAEYHVLEHVDEIYNAMLNQTNVGDNNNKFYEIQALVAYNLVRFLLVPFLKLLQNLMMVANSWFIVDGPKYDAGLELDYHAEESDGYDVLRRITDVIDQSDREKLEQLRGE
ncbi:hypothetical protein ACOSQ4_000433 [Xanthoceras sorbifolium]